MSHTTTVKSVAIRSVAALQAAVAELKANGVNCNLEEGANIAPRMYYGRQADELKGKTPYVLRLPNAQFDVGFQRFEENGEVTYSPVTDFHGGSVAREIGAKCGCDNKTVTSPEGSVGHLMQLYAKHAAIESAIAAGYTVDNIVHNEATGEIHISVDASSYGVSF